MVITPFLKMDFANIALKMETEMEDIKCKSCGGTGVNPLSDNLNWIPCSSCGGLNVNDTWQPTYLDTPKGLHTNPDAKAWAAFFVATFSGHKHMEDLMHGWFANAMMAMHDHIKNAESDMSGSSDSLAAVAGRMAEELLQWHPTSKALNAYNALMKGR